MNWRAVVAALPFLRWLWRWLPGPLRIIVVLVAAGIALARMLRGDAAQDDRSTDDDRGAARDDPPA